MQLKVYRRDNRRKDERRWHRYLFRLSAVVGSVILAVVVYRLSGPLGVAATSLYMPWYDLNSWGMITDNIHLLNPSGTSATGTIAVAGHVLSFLVPANGEWYGALPGTIGGPVIITVTSGPAVLGSQRVQFEQSFNEAPASA